MTNNSLTKTTAEGLTVTICYYMLYMNQSGYLIDTIILAIYHKKSQLFKSSISDNTCYF